MTQPQGPYSPPYQMSYPQGYGFDPLSQYLAPARRASILMFILGGLGFACGICIGLVALLVPMEQIIAQSGMELPSTAELNMTPAQLMKIVYVVLAIGTLLVSVLIIILAAFVRKGGMGSCITAAVLCAVVLLLLVLQLLVLAVKLGSVNPLEAGISFVMNIVLLALFGLQMMWLVQACRAAPSLKMARAHLQQQQWQYQQQMYPPQPYGYPQQQQPPPGAG